MNLDKFNSKYRYKTDTEKFGKVEVWEVIKPNKDGLYLGDCESYALTVKSIVDGYKDWKLHYCKLNGVGHCVLVKDDLVLDNNVQTPTSLYKYKAMFTVTDFRKYRWYEIVWKRVTTKLLGYVPFTK